MKKLEKEILPADIYCDDHPGDPVIYYNPIDNKLLCLKCKVLPGHSKMLTDRKIIDSDCKRLI